MNISDRVGKPALFSFLRTSAHENLRVYVDIAFHQPLMSKTELVQLSGNYCRDIIHCGCNSKRSRKIGTLLRQSASAEQSVKKHIIRMRDP